MRTLLLLAFTTGLLSAAILDRIAITVGQQVITEQQLNEEIRLTAFLNHQKIALTLENRRAAADRLVQQLLVKREMDLSQYPVPSDTDVEKYLSQVGGDFTGLTSFAAALAAYGLSEATLKEHLALQLTTLRFIEYRFRPDLPTSRDAVQQRLIEERTDEMLDAWLEESRKQVTIVYVNKTLQ